MRLHTLTIFVLTLLKETFYCESNANVRNEFYCCKTRLLEAKNMWLTMCFITFTVDRKFY